MNKLIPDGKMTSDELKNRSDLAIISDDISSGDELIEAYRKYLRLSRKGRRYSDYYSVKLYGCNVTNMFFTMSFRFKSDPPFPVNESFLVNEPDLYYNKKAFDKGDVNLCFVIGYSGSGKSYLTREYKGSAIEKVSLDDIVCVKDHYTLDELKASGDLLYSFFVGEGAKYYISREERDVFADHGKVFVEFINYARKYVSSHREKKYILEGIWTYLFFSDPSEFDDCAVFMKGTSLVKSRFRRMRREAGNDLSKSLDRLLDFGVYAMDTMLKDPNVDKWRRYFERKPETVIKLEDNRFTKLAESIDANMNRINELFVHGDGEGIRLLIDRVSGDCSIDLREKAVVIEECKRALADLK